MSGGLIVTDMGNQDSLTVEHSADGTIVVRGDIDVAGGPVLDVALREHEGSGPLVIDLANVSFIDSSGLRSLLTASRRARERATDVTLCNVGPEVLRLLQITGTQGHFIISGHRG
jgi:anti-sigma B factor antagonist